MAMGKLAENRTKRTAIKKAKFLAALRKRPNNITAAAESIGIERRRAYDWRDQDPDFAAAWDDTIEAATDAADAELYRRAVDGYDKPVYQGGALVGVVREYSDTCLIFFLKGRRQEKYNPVQKVAPTDPTGEHPFVFKDPCHDGM